MNVENRNVNPNLINNIEALRTAINEISVYDLNTYTAIELYYRIANKLNEVINELLRHEIVVSEQVIEQNKCLQYLLNEGLRDEVINKINSMVADGTMDTIINHNVFNNLNDKIENYKEELSSKIKDIENKKVDKNIVERGKQFNVKLGTSTWFQDYDDAGESALEKMYKHFDSIIQCVILTFDGNNFVASTNTNNQINNISDYINYGGKISGIKFHQSQNMKELFALYGVDLICTKYIDFVLNFISNLSYKNNINKVWIFNEAGNDVFTSSNENYIISAMNRVKNAGFSVSTPYANAYAITDSSQRIVNNNDFISLNLYPFNDIKGDRSSVNDLVDRFNKEFIIIERYLNKKDLYITEFGCSSSWESFTNPPKYKQDGIGKPISLFIEGFFRSKFASNVKGAWLWYYHDAYTYAPNTLLSIKNNVGVYYG